LVGGPHVGGILHGDDEVRLVAPDDDGAQLAGQLAGDHGPHHRRDGLVQRVPRRQPDVTGDGGDHVALTDGAVGHHQLDEGHPGAGLPVEQVLEGVAREHLADDEELADRARIRHTVFSAFPGGS
jgi:hypothetical protein